MASRAPLAWGLYAVAMMSVLFEPVRSSLYRLGQAVGGVGGVGGLTNQWGPTPHCTTTAGGGEAPWCFHVGTVLGFTTFAAVMMALCTLPLLVTALATHVWAPKQPKSGAATTAAFSTSSVTLAWDSASVLWFVTPLAAYLNAPFYQQTFWTGLVGVAICAAFPLSWHLSFVSLPASAAPLLAPVLGVSEDSLKALHVRTAKATVAWAALHVGGEVVYLLSQGTFASSVSVTQPAWEDDLVFTFGLVTASILVVHTLLAAFRKYPAVRSSFRRNHRLLAALLLLSATTHWWPFVIFLTPAIACNATGLALRGAKTPDVGIRDGPLALAAAVVGAVLGVSIVWALRQQYMVSWAPHDFRTPFVFPPAAVASGFALAAACATAVVTLRGGALARRQSLPAMSPLLPASRDTPHA